MTSPDRETVFVISDMCCAAEEHRIRGKLGSLPGIASMEFNVMAHRLTVRHSVPERSIQDALKEVGLPGYIDNRSDDGTRRHTRRRQLVSTVGAALLLAGGGLAETLSPSSLHAIILLGASMSLGGWQVALKAFRALRARTLDINVLMTVAVLGAIGLQEFVEAAAVIVLYAVSLLLESLTVDRARRAISSLLEGFPQTASVRRHASEVMVPVGEVMPGETVVIRPGERIPLDGDVVGGHSSVDQSPVTGESIPVSKRTGDPVFAGSFNQRGSLDVRVSRPAADSTIARIIHLVEEAQNQKAGLQTFQERFARVYTPAVFIGAVAVATIPPLILGTGWEEWFYRALVLLVISCPCALLISTPITLVSAITAGARNGLLFKGGRHIEMLAAVRSVAVDKTGTLTSGHLAVKEVVRMNSMEEDELLRLAAVLESRSEHPVAEAVVREARERNLAIAGLHVEGFEAIHGRGVSAVVDGRKLSAGNHQLTEDLKVCSPAVEEAIASLEEQGQSVIVLADDRQVLGLIGIADTSREDGGMFIQELHRLGIARVVLLTGDSHARAAEVGASVGIDDIRAGLLPEQKLKAIHDLRLTDGPVCMVGDGINDAPALAAADIGIAMGAAGSDTAIQTADVVLMSDNLSRIPFGIRLSRRTVGIIFQNIVFALGVKALFLLLGVMGMTSLWFAILADDGAALAVALNGLRLLRSRPVSA